MQAVGSRLLLMLLGAALICLFPLAAFAQSKDDATQSEAARKDALAVLIEADRKLDEALGVYHELEHEVETVTYKITLLTDRISDYESEVRDLRTRAESLVANAYMSAGTALVDVALEIGSIQDLLTVQVVLDRATNNDLVSVGRLDVVQREMNRLRDGLDVDQQRSLELQAQAEANVVDLDELQIAALSAYADAKAKAAEALAKYEAEKRRQELQAAARQQGAASGLPPQATPSFQCPVPAGRFINDWGFARSGGRTHKGTDVFAAKGTNIYSVDSGTVTLSNRGLGGIAVKLRGDSGHSYYFAHLDGYPPGLSTGDRVSKSQVIGYVGNTGNAYGGSPHLHFGIWGWHGSWVNPFQTLRSYC